MQKLLTEIEAGAINCLVGLRDILITYKLQAAGASHNVQVSGLSPVLRTQAIGNIQQRTFNKPGAFYFQHDHVPVVGLILSLAPIFYT